jgi:hypothetical protein
VLHCEDDWLFDRLDFIEPSLTLIELNNNISGVCVRKLSDFAHTKEQHSKIKFFDCGGASFARLDKTHPQWHSFSFNPHIAPVSIWKNLGGLSRFKKERHVSRTLRSQGMYFAYWQPGACIHTGFDQSVSIQPDTGVLQHLKHLCSRIISK